VRSIFGQIRERCTKAVILGSPNFSCFVKLINYFWSTLNAVYENAMVGDGVACYYYSGGAGL
jgi:hypothetical protein